MLTGLALLLLVCLHMRVQGKPRSQVGPAPPLMGLGGTWERQTDADTVLPSVSFLWTLCSEVWEVVGILRHACRQRNSAQLLDLVVKVD